MGNGESSSCWFFFLLVCVLPVAFVAGDAEHRLYQGRSQLCFTNAVCQDADGFVWMEFYGLEAYRFDGVDFKCYLHDESDSASLSDNMVRCLYMDRAVVCGSGRPAACNIIVPNQTISGPVPIHGVSGVGGFVTCITQRRKTGEVWFIASGIRMFRVEGHEACR